LPTSCACKRCVTGSSRATSRSRASSAGPTSRSAATGPSAGTGCWCAVRSASAGRPLVRRASPTVWSSHHRPTRRPHRRPRGGRADRASTPNQPLGTRGRRRCERCGPGWPNGACCGTAGGRGRQRPRRQRCNGCLAGWPLVDRSGDHRANYPRDSHKPCPVASTSIGMLVPLAGATPSWCPPTSMAGYAESLACPGMRDGERSRPGTGTGDRCGWRCLGEAAEEAGWSRVVPSVAPPAVRSPTSTG